MFTATSRLRIIDRHVNASVIDGEAILINLESGLYHSLDPLGTAAWQLLVAGHSIGDSADLLARACSADASVVRSDLLRLADELAARTLVATLETSAAPASAVDLSTVARLPWVAPILSTYDDMGDVLALDPPLPQVSAD